MKKRKKVHAASGSTSFKREVGRCKLTVIPSNWTDEHGPSVWAVTCGDYHKRGNAPTRAAAQQAARYAARRRARRR